MERKYREATERLHYRRGIGKRVCLCFGQITGQGPNKEGDLVVNVTKSKKLTNVRASGSDDKAQLAPPIIFSLEEALEYIKEDEYVEVTPKHTRIRKILLDENDRKRLAKKG